MRSHQKEVAHFFQLACKATYDASGPRLFCTQIKNTGPLMLR